MGAIGSVRFFNGIEECTRRLYQMKTNPNRYQVVDVYDDGTEFPVTYLGARIMSRESAEYLMNQVKS